MNKKAEGDIKAFLLIIFFFGLLVFTVSMFKIPITDKGEIPMPELPSSFGEVTLIDIITFPVTFPLTQLNYYLQVGATVINVHPYFLVLFFIPLIYLFTFIGARLIRGS